MTPERQKQLLDSFMADREPKYRALFDSWQLDSTSASLALMIIRDRETQVREALHEINLTGMSGLKAFGEASRTAEEYAKIQLNALLGEEHFGELSKKDAQMNAELGVIAQKYINSRE